MHNLYKFTEDYIHNRIYGKNSQSQTGEELADQHIFKVPNLCIISALFFFTLVPVFVHCAFCDSLTGNLRGTGRMLRLDYNTSFKSINGFSSHSCFTAM